MGRDGRYRAGEIADELRREGKERRGRLRHRPDALADLDKVLTRAKCEVTNWGGKLVFVYLPAKTRYVSVLGQADAGAYAEEVRDVVSRNGLPIIDVASRLDREPNPRAL